jgi:hypothetical protein
MKASLAIVLVAFFVPASLQALEKSIFRPDLPGDGSLAIFNKLTVTVRGSGKVESNPGTLVCQSNGTSPTICEGFFLPDTQVALDATAISGETFTASFGQWSGDCNGTVGACAVTMDSDKAATAQFVALGIPAFTLPMPNATETIGYHAPVEPVEDPDPNRSKPVAVGSYSEGISIKVGLPPFFQPVDMYLGLSFPNSSDIFLLDSSNSFVNVSSGGLVPWKSSHAASVEETLFEGVSIEFLPEGVYDIYFMVTPAGDLSTYYLWRSDFTVFPNGNPLVP